MSALHDELVAKAPNLRCITCSFLTSLKPSDRAEWEAELKLTTIPNEAFADAIRLRGMTITAGAVRAHRKHHQ